MWNKISATEILRKSFPNLIGYDNSVYISTIPNHALLNSFAIKCVNSEFIVTVINTEHELFNCLDLSDVTLLTLRGYLNYIQTVVLEIDAIKLEYYINRLTDRIVLNKHISDFSWKKLIKNANK